MEIKRKILLVENTPAKAAAKAAVKKAAIKSAARDVSKGVEATPIEVFDPKDSRLRAYSDSLSLYNKQRNKLKKVKLNSRDSDLYLKKGIPKKEILKSSYDFVNYRPINTSGEYDSAMNPNNNFPAPKKKQKILPIAGIGVNSGNSMGGWVDIYKKPTQPIVYKKPTKKPIESKVVKADTIQTKPRVKKTGERIVADNASGGGYPNIDNVYINNRLDSIQNQAGERLKYGTKFTKEWQYRKKK